MSVRRLFAGVATTSLVAASVALMAPAQADPSFAPVAGDIIGVGSDTSQDALNYLADGKDGVVGYNSGRTVNRLANYNATGGGTIALPSGAITRPNGSGAGKALLYGAGNNADVDFARSSSAISATEKSAGLFAFPFAKDTLALATATTSNAPASISAADMVKIYDGTFTNWSQVTGGNSGVIAPKIPQTGSGTRSFFTDQLRAANGGNAVVLANTVAEVQEHDDTTIKANSNAVAPFSVGRAGLLGTLRIEGGFTAARALYNVVRQADVAKPEVTSIFGSAGFACSTTAKALISKAGFEQLASSAKGGVCGVPTQDPTSNLALNQQVATTTTVAGTSPAAGTARLVATVAATTAPDGLVDFYLDGSATKAGSASLVGGKATRDITDLVAGAHTVVAKYVPAGTSNFDASESASTTVTVVADVKATSKVAESFKSKIKSGKRAKGVVTIKSSVAGRVAAGKIVIKLKKKVVGKGTLKGGKVTIKLKALPKGKNKLKVTYVPSAGNIGGSTKTFKIKQL